MIERKVVLSRRFALHARPCARLVKESVRFNAEVVLESAGTKVNGKDIMGVMLLAGDLQTSLTVYAEGPDEVEAVSAIVDLIYGMMGMLDED